jgi:hypothetical protein
VLRSIIDGHVVLLDASDKGVQIRVVPDPPGALGVLSGTPVFERFLGGVPVNPLAVIEKVREGIDGFRSAGERATINRAVIEEVAKALGGVWEAE